MPTDNQKAEKVISEIASTYKRNHAEVKAEPQALPNTAQVGDVFYDTETDSLYFCFGRVEGKFKWVLLTEGVNKTFGADV